MITQPCMWTPSRRKEAVLTSSFASLVLRYYVILFTLISVLYDLTNTAASWKILSQLQFSFRFRQIIREILRNLKILSYRGKYPVPNGSLVRIVMWWNNGLVSSFLTVLRRPHDVGINSIRSRLISQPKRLTLQKTNSTARFALFPQLA